MKSRIASGQIVVLFYSEVRASTSLVSFPPFILTDDVCAFSLRRRPCVSVSPLHLHLHPLSPLHPRRRCTSIFFFAYDDIARRARSSPPAPISSPASQLPDFEFEGDEVILLLQRFELITALTSSATRRR
ncbi:hypothetical protein SCHPADRAFT_617466 [Schizopora paradoxa]|uniref:Uncharacterized protein n=1 Tax=Schizopora paradoxa TaxID=27342 RepID=A0A0H2RF74_9AGAM|nr:hypothetical protein SCHPADRAFT_617466 [Schizopora paradoxa]